MFLHVTEIFIDILKSSKKAEDLSVANEELESKLAEAEKVNKRLKEGNFIVQDQERKMSAEHKEMKTKYDEMIVENQKCRELAENTKGRIYRRFRSG